MTKAPTIADGTPASLSVSEPAEPPTLTANGIVPQLLDQSRRLRSMFFRNFQQLELEAMQATGRGRMIAWMDENYGDAMKLAPKFVMKEPEAAPHATVEDLLDELDRRSATAKTIEG